MATKHATKKAKRATKKAAKRSTKSPSPRKLLLISALSSSHAILKIGHGGPAKDASGCYKCETLRLIESALKSLGVRSPEEAA